MTSIEALERLVGSRILAVELLDGEGAPWGVEITTTDGETIRITSDMYDETVVSVKQ